MAILKVEIDTEAGTCDASVNGTSVENLDGLSVYNYGRTDKPEFTFELRTREIKDGVMYTHCISAAKQAPANAIQSSLAPDLLDVVKRESNKDAVVANLTDYLTKKIGK